MTEKAKKEDLTYRVLPIQTNERGEPSTWNEDELSVEVVGATEDPVPVFDYDRYELVDEVLLMSGLELPSKNRVPLLDSHSRYSTSNVIGSFRDLAVAKDELTGKAVFSAVGAVEDTRTKVKEGHLTDFSAGYLVNESTWIPDREKAIVAGRTFQGPLKVTTKWKIKELSVVPIGADERAIARQDAEIKANINQRSEGETTMNDTIDIEKLKKEIRADLEKEFQTKSREDIEKASQESADRVREIIAIGDQHKMEEDATRFITENKSVDEFRQFVLSKLKTRGATPVEDTDPEIGLTDKEKKRFSFLNVIRMLAHPGDQGFRDAAAFEVECSRAVEDKTRKSPKGIFIPTDVLRHDYTRDMNTYTGAQGGYLVDNVLAAGSFIEALENVMVVKSLGAIMLRDLVGDLSIPKQTGGATAYWIGEGDDISESQQALGQVALRPKGVGAFTDLTRKFMLQSSIDAEMFVRNDLALRLALAIDLAAIAGSGAGGQPMGILNTTGIGSVTLNAANAPDWGDIVDMEKAVAVDNALVGNLAYVTNATIVGAMKQTEKATGYPVYIMEKGETNGYRCLLSNQVTAKHILFGNWRDLVIGEWSGVDVNVDTATLSKSGGIRVVVIQDVDVAVRHAESFADGYHV